MFGPTGDATKTDRTDAEALLEAVAVAGSPVTIKTVVPARLLA
jgi:hypothetical protein